MVTPNVKEIWRQGDDDVRPQPAQGAGGGRLSQRELVLQSLVRCPTRGRASGKR